MSIAYYNGELSEYSELKIPVSDRSIFFGDGVYEACIGHSGGIYLFDEHADRLFANARRLSIPISFDRAELFSIISSLIEKNGFNEYFIYLQLTRYSPDRIHAYPDTEKSNLLISIREHTLPSREKLLSLISEEDIRYAMCDAKTLNLLPAVLASKRAEGLGCDEAVFIRDGLVTECAHSNISILKNGTLYTRALDRYILPGITRARLLYVCDRLGVPVNETAFTYSDMLSADEVIISSTTKLIMRAGCMDKITIGGKDMALFSRIYEYLYSDFREGVQYKP
jgi:D-alanine transaminase